MRSLNVNVNTVLTLQIVKFFCDQVLPNLVNLEELQFGFLTDKNEQPFDDYFTTKETYTKNHPKLVRIVKNDIRYDNRTFKTIKRYLEAAGRPLRVSFFTMVTLREYEEIVESYPESALEEGNIVFETIQDKSKEISKLIS